MFQKFWTHMGLSLANKNNGILVFGEFNSAVVSLIWDMLPAVDSI
jgi:hypothetical protein